MNNETRPFDRLRNESDFTWQRRVKKYIGKNAPQAHRSYARNGKPDARGQRWFLPGTLVLIGIAMAAFSYTLGADVRNLNSSNAKQGEFIVQSLTKRSHKRADPVYYPNVVIRGELVEPLFSNDREFEVGSPITLKYTVQGKVIAAFMEDDGKVPYTGSIALTAMAVIVTATGILIGKFYRGTVDSQYIDDEYAKLTKTI